MRVLYLIRNSFSSTGIALLVMWASSFPSYSVEVNQLPNSPGSHFYIEDTIKTSFISESTRSKINQTFLLHETNAGDQIVFAVFESLASSKGVEDVVSVTNEIFKKWAIGEYGKNNGALLAVFLKERKIRLEVGYGLEPLLTDAKSKRIISEILQPFLKANQTDEAFLATAYAILETIESPVLNTEASLIKPPLNKNSKRMPKSLAIGIIFFIVVILNLFNRITSRSTTYYSRSTNRNSDSLLPFHLGGHTRGGGFDSIFGGGGGGFLGGGGRSGGGGASGDW